MSVSEVLRKVSLRATLTVKAGFDMADEVADSTAEEIEEEASSTLSLRFSATSAWTAVAEKIAAASKALQRILGNNWNNEQGVFCLDRVVRTQRGKVKIKWRGGLR